MFKPPLKSLGLGLVILLFAVATWANRTGKLDPQPYSDTGTLIPITADTTFPSGSIPVECGITVQKVYDFAVQAETFSADGWVWLIWPEAFQDLLTTRNIAPESILKIVNTAQTSSLSLTAENPPQKLPDGRTYQLFRFSGKFFAVGLDFRHFPFETLRLPIIFGLNADTPALSVARAHLVADTDQSGLGEFTHVPGYVNTGMRIFGTLFQFPTSFGLPVEHPETDSRFSRVQMNVVYHTSATAALLQIILPLVVVMTILLLAPNLAGSLWNVRTVIPPSLLLALVLQAQAYRAKIPQLSYLTFMDQMYTVCFAIALIIFGLFVWTSNQLDNATPENRAATVARINRTDLRFQIGLTCALAIILILAWFFPGQVH